MKKFLALTLAALMVLTLAVSVSAEDGDVNVIVNVDEPDVFKYTVSWESFDFTYNVTKTWSDASQTYSEDGDWDKQTATVTVTNTSNIDIIVTFSYEDNIATNITEIDVGLVDGENLVEGLSPVTLGNKADNDLDLTTTATVKVDGTPTSESKGTTLVGTVNVSVVAA